MNKLSIVIAMSATLLGVHAGFAADEVIPGKGLYRDRVDASGEKNEADKRKGLYRDAGQKPNSPSSLPPEVEVKLPLTEQEAQKRLEENASKSIELSTQFATLVQKHLELAGNYDVDAFRKNDDELASLFEKMDANYLESRMLYKHLGLPEEPLTADKKSIQDSKLFMYKSSAIFNLCFGRPMNSAQLSRLSLNLGEHLSGKKDFEPDVLYYLGTALCWAGDYKNAETQLKSSMTIGKGRPFTQLKAGAPVNVGGQNPFAAQQLATVLLAKSENSKAIDLLKQTRANAPSEEVRGQADALLAVASAVSGGAQTKEFAANAKKELSQRQGQTFPGVATEFLAIANAVEGNYEAADKIFSEAIPKLQDSPIKLGQRLEAAQASLWRAYCRDRLGNKAGSEQDMKYAMSFADEAPHLVTVSKMLDKVFGKELPKPISNQPRQKWAIVVGLSNFADPKIPKLKYPKKDAEDMAKFLVDHGSFQANHIRTLTDDAATKERLLNSIAGDWLPTVTKPNDVVFIFVSSHGTPAYEDVGAMNSVVTYDTKMDQLFSTSIPMQNIVRLLSSKLSKRHVFVVLDTCYAGGLGAPVSKDHTLNSVDPELLLSSNYQLLVSSSSGNERSWESKRYPNSVFTRQMIDTLAENKDYERFNAVFDLVQKKVSAEVSADYKGNSQTPSFSGLWQGKELAR